MFTKYVQFPYAQDKDIHSFLYPWVLVEVEVLGRAHPKPPRLFPASMGPAGPELTCSDLPLHKSLFPSSVTVPEPRPHGNLQMAKNKEMGRKLRKGRPRHGARGSPSSAEAWLRSCSRQGQLLWRREVTRQEKQPGNSLALQPHYPQKLSLESGGGRENLKSVGPRDKAGVKRGPCAWGLP